MTLIIGKNSTNVECYADWITCQVKFADEDGKRKERKGVTRCEMNISGSGFDSACRHTATARNPLCGRVRTFNTSARVRHQAA